ncbi:sigma-70 family RNA polymerase sigma factor [Streptomyces sp. NPDC059456]|uniref:sigma-70 family RNA polymerase sigma factor n=1 Tax=Streptomyces sp. NPDC059456 TaxID=3346838 RepID=UPI0036B551ED
MPTELEGDGIAVRDPLSVGQSVGQSAPDDPFEPVGCEDDARRARRLRNDAKIVEILRMDGFEGPRYAKVVERLSGYAWPTMVKWCGTGEVFHRAATVGRPVPRNMIVSDWSQDDRFEIATDSVINGMALFRTYGLVQGRWHADGGASLTTYCMGAVIRAFGPVYKAWYDERRTGQSELRRAGTDEEADPMAAIPDQRAADPCQVAATNDEIRRILPMVKDAKVLESLGWYAVGCTQEQAAQRVGLTRKALERRTHRLRNRINESGVRRPEPEEGEAR